MTSPESSQLRYSAPRLSSLPATPRDTFPGPRAAFGLLILLSAVAAFLRFWRLDQQAYWFDESATLGRIVGSLDLLFRELATQGFPSGWYLLLRAWGRLGEAVSGSPGFAYGPLWLRALPALFGTLMVPAMYFLARQFADRRGGLLVALLTAVNPFLIYYSRDLKMYAAFWFFVALHAAACLYWMGDTRRFWRYVLFLLTGAAMVECHGIGWAIIALELVWLFTQPRLRAWDGPLWLLAVALMSIAPLIDHAHKSVPLQGSLEQGAIPGVQWNQSYTDMSLQTILGLPTSQLMGFLWPKYPPDIQLNKWFALGGTFNDHLATRAWPWLATVQLGCGMLLVAILFAGLFPWRHLPTAWTRLRARARGGLWTAVLWGLLPLTLLILAASIWWGHLRNPERPESVTRNRAWWVALWILLPTGLLVMTWPEFVGQSAYDWFWNLLRLRPKESVWEPRYLGVITPAMILWLAASLRRLPSWPLRAGAILFVTAVSVAFSLPNHLLYRQAPWMPTVRAIQPYYNLSSPRPETILVGIPQIHFPNEAYEHTAQAILGERPRAAMPRPDGPRPPRGPLGPRGPESRPFAPPNAPPPPPPGFDGPFAPGDAPPGMPPGGPPSPGGPGFVLPMATGPFAAWPLGDKHDPPLSDERDRPPLGRSLDTFLLFATRTATLRTIVLTDRYADIPTGPWSTQTIGNTLGAQWQLVHEQTYRWHYEWRYYFFHNWRTRVWIRQLPEDNPPPPAVPVEPRPKPAEPSPVPTTTPGRRPNIFDFQ